MSLFDVSPKDVQRGYRFTPGWYLIQVNSVGDLTPPKSGGDTLNCLIDGTIVKNADTGDTKEAGYSTPGTWMFNTGAPGFTVGFLRALGEEVVPGRVNLKVAEGKLIEAYIEDNEYKGVIGSKVAHQYRAPRG